MHVLSIPIAFILSQNQTQKILYFTHIKIRMIFELKSRKGYFLRKRLLLEFLLKKYQTTLFSQTLFEGLLRIEKPFSVF